jgi:hypothetical protein
MISRVALLNLHLNGLLGGSELEELADYTYLQPEVARIILDNFHRSLACRPLGLRG